MTVRDNATCMQADGSLAERPAYKTGASLVLYFTGGCRTAANTSRSCFLYSEHYTTPKHPFGSLYSKPSPFFNHSYGEHALLTDIPTSYIFCQRHITKLNHGP